MKKLILKKEGIQKVSLDALFNQFHSAWLPHLAGTFNGQQIQLLKFIGPFEWISYPHDVLYHIHRGNATLQLFKKNIDMYSGESIIVPKKTRHRLASSEQVYLVMIKPAAAI